MHVTTGGIRASTVDLIQTKPLSNPNTISKLDPTVNINNLSQSFANARKKSHYHDKVVLDGVSDNMNSLLQTGKYFSTNTLDITTMRYLIIEFVSRTFTSQEEISTDWKLGKAKEIATRASYLSNIITKTNWY